MLYLPSLFNSMSNGRKKCALAKASILQYSFFFFLAVLLIQALFAGLRNVIQVGKESRVNFHGNCSSLPRKQTSEDILHFRHK